MARTLPFHGKNVGSIPTENKENSSMVRALVCHAEDAGSIPVFLVDSAWLSGIASVSCTEDQRFESFRWHAFIAQWIECRVSTSKVVGSTPTRRFW